MPGNTVLVLHDFAQIICQLDGTVDIEVVIVVKIRVIVDACLFPVAFQIDVVIAVFLHNLSRLVGALDAFIGGGVDHVRHADKRHVQLLLLAKAQQFPHFLFKRLVELDAAVLDDDFVVEHLFVRHKHLGVGAEAAQVIGVCKLHFDGGSRAPQRFGQLLPKVVVLDERKVILPLQILVHTAVDKVNLVLAQGDIVCQLACVRLYLFIFGFPVEIGVRLNQQQLGLLCADNFPERQHHAVGGKGFRRHRIARKAVFFIRSACGKAGIDLACAEQHHVQITLFLPVIAVEPGHVVVELAQHIALQKGQRKDYREQQAGNLCRPREDCVFFHTVCLRIAYKQSPPRCSRSRRCRTPPPLPCRDK